MASITISDIDEQSKLNFEQLSASFNMNTATVFDVLVKIGMSFKAQGLFVGTAVKADAPLPETHAQKQLAAFKRFVAANRSIDDEPIGEDFDAIITDGVNIGEDITL